MLLAAGRGDRLKPWTDHTPKPLLEVAGKPLIIHHLEHLAAAGLTDIVINLAHLGDQIEHALGDGDRFGVHIQYSREHTALETGGGIFNALPLLGKDPFLVINADIWTDLPLRQLTTCPILLAHIVLVPNPAHNPKGDFYLHASGKMDQQRFASNSTFISEEFNPGDSNKYNQQQHASSDHDHSVNDNLYVLSNVDQQDEPKWTFSGIGIYRPELFKECQPGKFRLPSVFETAISQRQLTGEIYRGHWFDVGTIERWQTLNQFLLNSSFHR